MIGAGQRVDLWMCKEVVIGASFVFVQGIIDDQLEVRGRGDDRLSVRHEGEGNRLFVERG